MMAAGSTPNCRHFAAHDGAGTSFAVTVYELLLNIPTGAYLVVDGRLEGNIQKAACRNSAILETVRSRIGHTGEEHTHSATMKLHFDRHVTITEQLSID